jgi:hypothetical protein
MEEDVARLYDTKHKTCAMTKDDDDALKRKGQSSWQREDMVIWQEYHGDGDVDGSLHKIGNTGVIDVDERKARRLQGQGEGWRHGDMG